MHWMFCFKENFELFQPLVRSFPSTEQKLKAKPDTKPPCFVKTEPYLPSQRRQFVVTEVRSRFSG